MKRDITDWTAWDKLMAQARQTVNCAQIYNVNKKKWDELKETQDKPPTEPINTKQGQFYSEYNDSWTWL